MAQVGVPTCATRRANRRSNEYNAGRVDETELQISSVAEFIAQEAESKLRAAVTLLDRNDSNHDSVSAFVLTVSGTPVSGIRRRVISSNPSLKHLCDEFADWLVALDAKNDAAGTPGGYDGGKPADDKYWQWYDGLHQMLRKWAPQCSHEFTVFCLDDSDSPSASVIVLQHFNASDDIEFFGIPQTSDDSLVRRILVEVRGHAEDALVQGGIYMSQYGKVTFRDDATTIRLAATYYLNRLLSASDDFDPGSAIGLLETIAGMTYEGEGLAGALALARPALASKSCIVEFTSPVLLRIENARLIRKLMQSCSVGGIVVCDGKSLLGTCLRDANSLLLSESDTTLIEFVAPHHFRVVRREAVVFELYGGLPRRQSRKIESHVLVVALHEVCQSRPPVDAISKFIAGSNLELRGAIIVITDKAAEESKRLAKSCISITPLDIRNARAILSMTKVDGALLFDTDAKCHCFGAILDGESTEEQENSSRGSRFNSAVRYIETQSRAGVNCLALVFSEDGGADLIRPSSKKLASS